MNLLPREATNEETAANNVFSREKILERVWSNDTHVTDRSVDTLVKRLRQKIETDTRQPSLILTVWGTGYKFADE